MNKIIFCCIFIISIYVYTINIGDVFDINNESNIQLPIEFYENKNGVNTIVQEFSLKKSGKLYAISLKSGTYMRKNTGNINIFIEDENNKVIARNVISKSSLIDNEFNQFNFFPVKLKENQIYKLIININDNYENNMLTFYFHNYHSGKIDKKLLVDEKNVKGSLIYRLNFINR